MRVLPLLKFYGMYSNLGITWCILSFCLFSAFKQYWTFFIRQLSLILSRLDFSFAREKGQFSPTIKVWPVGYQGSECAFRQKHRVFCRPHLICFPFLREYIPNMYIVQGLKTDVSYILQHFLVFLFF